MENLDQSGLETSGGALFTYKEKGTPFFHPQDEGDEQSSSYDYFLPPQQIAQRPATPRDGSRMLCCHSLDNWQADDYFYHWPNFLPAGTLVIANQSQVFPCRLLAKKKTQGSIEVFLLWPRPNDQGQMLCLLKSNGPKKLGSEIILPEELVATIIDRDEEGQFLLAIHDQKIDWPSYLQRSALIPLPAYIRKGLGDQRDNQDYQTTFAKHCGSVAAPTAGLHMSDRVLKALEEKSIQIEYLTLHVGLGTFRPLKSELLSQHSMHQEFFSIPEKTLKAYIKAKEEGRAIVAIGTTTLRALESCYNQEKEFKAQGSHFYSTRLFIRPGKEVLAVDGLLTNFHLPKSTLLVLVSALLGRKRALELYKHAVENDYRFFSYGDAMFIANQKLALAKHLPRSL